MNVGTNGAGWIIFLKQKTSPGFWRWPTLITPRGLLPSAQKGLTSVFGMGTGVTPSLETPEL